MAFVMVYLLIGCLVAYGLSKHDEKICAKYGLKYTIDYTMFFGVALIGIPAMLSPRCRKIVYIGWSN